MGKTQASSADFVHAPVERTRFGVVPIWYACKYVFSFEMQVVEKKRIKTAKRSNLSHLYLRCGFHVCDSDVVVDTNIVTRLLHIKIAVL